MDTLVLTVDNLESAKSAVELLKADGVAGDRIRILTPSHSHENEDIVGANEATLLEVSDLENSRKRGVLIGGVIGTTIGIIALFVGGTNWLVVPAGLVLGIGLGALSSQLIGVSEKNPALEAAEEDVLAGKVAIVLDVEHKKHDEVAQHLHSLLPNAKLLEADIAGRVAKI